MILVAPSNNPFHDYEYYHHERMLHLYQHTYLYFVSLWMFVQQVIFSELFLYTHKDNVDTALQKNEKELTIEKPRLLCFIITFIFKPMTSRDKVNIYNVFFG